MRTNEGLWIATVVTVLAMTGCAAQRAEGPLDVSLGLSRDETAHALRRYDFCAQVEPARDHEVYPQCDHPGAGYGQAWVIATYQGGRLARLQRFERWVDAARAAERWNHLVEKRAATTPLSQDARDRIFARQQIPERTRTWAAFRAGEHLVGVYLLTPATAEDPSILEEIIPAAAPPPPPY